MCVCHPACIFCYVGGPANLPTANLPGIHLPTKLPNYLTVVYIIIMVPGSENKKSTIPLYRWNICYNCVYRLLWCYEKCQDIFNVQTTTARGDIIAIFKLRQMNDHYQNATWNLLVNLVKCNKKGISFCFSYSTLLYKCAT